MVNFLHLHNSNTCSPRFLQQNLIVTSSVILSKPFNLKCLNPTTPKSMPFSSKRLITNQPIRKEVNPSSVIVFRPVTSSVCNLLHLVI